MITPVCTASSSYNAFICLSLKLPYGYLTLNAGSLSFAYTSLVLAQFPLVAQLELSSMFISGVLYNLGLLPRSKMAFAVVCLKLAMPPSVRITNGP